MRVPNKGQLNKTLHKATLTILASGGTFVSWKNLNIASVSERGD